MYTKRLDGFRRVGKASDLVVRSKIAFFSGVASYTGTTDRSGSNGMSSTSSASTFLEGFPERGVDRAGTVTRTLYNILEPSGSPNFS